MSLTRFDEPIYVTRPLFPDLEEVNDSLKEIWESRILTNGGPKHRQLEQEINHYLKVQANCLFNNGTIALLVACQALGLSGEVITTPFTFPATPNILAWNGLTPVFCDIDPLTLTIDSKKIESLITSKTSAILGVHVYGTPCAVYEIQEIAERHKLKVIYDAAHAFGVEFDDKGIGSFGDISMFSFHATKLFHTIEGGCLTCPNPEIKQKIDLLKNFGIKNENEVVLPGINGKMNEVQAAIGLINLGLIKDEKDKRQRQLAIYRKELADIPGLYLLQESPGVTPSCQYFVIRIRADQFGCSRDEVYSRLQDYNVIARKYFYPLCSNYPCYQSLPSSNPSQLPVANEVVQEVLSLPLYGELSLEQVMMICQMIKSFYKGKYNPIDSIDHRQEVLCLK